ncbi:DNA internalization-related competence protein ComEC/Rec2 [Roseateles chitosanitabidus]|uniref:DNA internalization-related competence protein ComEC/Rec2 n=1 Tax=Roseateles chitosanitabidus TaxID=65048 RepID=UPI0011DFB17F|nr:DNA internalization-related competence protein ComEC/Rec2 [Roseateles chitosanitabidus]
MRRGSYTPSWCWSAVPAAALLGMGTVHLLPVLPGARVWLAVGLATALVAIALAVDLASVLMRGPGRIPTRPWRLWARERWLAWALLAALGGFGSTAWRAGLRMAEVLPVALEGQVLTLTGRVDSLPQRTEGMGGVEGWRFVFDVDGAERGAEAGASLQPPPRVLLSCYEMPATPRAGERWRLAVKLRRPRGLANPQGFDQALWMLAQDLPAAGSCRRQGQLRLEAGGFGVTALRQSLRDAIERHLAAQGGTAGQAAPGEMRRGIGVLAALSLGDQGAVGARDWALYRDTGVAHLLSVSGLHVTMFAWLAGAIAGAAWRRSARLCLRWPAPRAAMGIGVAAAGVYALFSGWGVPAQRTFGLLLILALLRLGGARWPWPMSLLSAAAGVCLADPWALAQPGFWLSFCAVALLMAADLRPEAGLRGALRGAWRTQWLVTLGLAPLTLLLFQQLSPAGLLANAVAIPLVTYAITPLAMLGAIASPLWTVGSWLVGLLNLVLETLRDLPLAVWHAPWSPDWAKGLGLAGGVAAALPWPGRLRLAGLALCVPMLWPAVGRPPSGQVELWLPDVGQGGAALVRTQGHTLVFDSGPRWGPGSDAGQRVLLPLLRGLGERRIDLLMVSHADQDHAGGNASLLQGLPVTRRFGAVPGGAPCERGQRWTWDGVRFEVLAPEVGEGTALKRNASSCVLRIDAGDRRVLLTGDIEAPQEARLLRREGARGLAAEVLVVPHHGSRTSSSAPFVRAVAPRVAAIQSGYLNRFGHPRAEVVARYRAAGARVLNSVDCGAWRWRSDRREPPVAGCERAQRRRYWLPAALDSPPVPPTESSLGASTASPTESPTESSGASSTEPLEGEAALENSLAPSVGPTGLSTVDGR